MQPLLASRGAGSDHPLCRGGTEHAESVPQVIRRWMQRRPPPRRAGAVPLHRARRSPPRSAPDRRVARRPATRPSSFPDQLVARRRAPRRRCRRRLHPRRRGRTRRSPPAHRLSTCRRRAGCDVSPPTPSPRTPGDPPGCGRRVPPRAPGESRATWLVGRPGPRRRGQVDTGLLGRAPPWSPAPAGSAECSSARAPTRAPVGAPTRAGAGRGGPWWRGRRRALPNRVAPPGRGRAPGGRP